MRRNCPGPLRTTSFRNSRVQTHSSVLGPDATSFSSSPYVGSHDVKRRNSTAYSSGVKSPPQPQDSFPTPQYFTRNGSGEPAAARASANVVLPAGGFQISPPSHNPDAGKLLTVPATSVPCPGKLPAYTKPR